MGIHGFLSRQKSPQILHWRNLPPFTRNPSFVSTTKTQTPSANLQNPEPISKMRPCWQKLKYFIGKERKTEDVKRQELFPMWTAERCWFHVDLGIGYRVLGAFHGWLWTSTWLTVLACTLQSCSLFRILVTSPWWPSLCTESYQISFILVVLIEYLIFPLEVSYFYIALTPWYHSCFSSILGTKLCHFHLA